ncbi:Ppx/GppA phosphatase family protein [Haloglycomyces albus]|uniref:Ppx/GppA phosphatase family protein n=1 Tax=Haloglycomyces albus TaxID=526067 RepID=UPI00046C93FE|nr:Ppx/GppA phosphatase family protein [Haloglycomyces albus]
MSRVAGIDCGTNSIRLLIADVDEDGVAQDVVRRMEVVRLGEGVDETGRLSPAALERTRRALESYAADMSDHGVEAVRMVATSATRDASNSAEFTALVESTIGIKPEVISGGEEAELSYTGAMSRLPPTDAPRLLVDTGGGSTEFVLGEGEDVIASRSVQIGCVRMTERHFRTDPPSSAELDAALLDISTAVDEALAEVSTDHGPDDFVAVAGTATTLAGVALGLDRYDPAVIDGTRLSYSQVEEVTQELAAMDVSARSALGVMHPGRADVIVGGALILRTIMERAGLATMLVSEHDILDGITISAAQRP